MSSRKPNTIRIIGGSWRRRVVSFPDLPGLRPTGDRIRETLFNWLQPYIAGAKCLDLFAGSGALGFEALSRGAERVTFVDSHPAVISAIQKNVELLKVEHEQVELVIGRCPEQTLSLLNSPYDIVFLDPPFHNGRLPEIVSWLEEADYFKPNALLYLEMEKQSEMFSLPGWELFKSGKTKRISYCLLRKES